MKFWDIVATVAMCVVGWKLGEAAYRKLGIHEIELFANSVEEEG